MSRPALSYRSERCEALDPLQVFAAAGSAPRFYWEQPATQRFRVGIGCAERVTVAGPGRFHAAATGASELFDRIAWEGPGPRVGHLVGGFAFAPTPQSTGLWRGFPDGELRLPELVYSREGDRYVRDVCRGSRWASLQPRPLPLGHPVRGVVEFGNGGPDAYVERVERALAEIQSGRLQKVVLARGVHVTARSSIDPVAWLVALRERFPACTLFAVGEGDAVFLGASPERLIRVDGERVETAALAGTAPRGGSQAADRALGEALCECRKNGAEHAAVVDYLKSVLSDCCDDVEVAPEPTLLRTRTVQHLCTELHARRRPGAPVPLLDLVSRMHPTPAVGGAPRVAALHWLAMHEGIERGWFAGPVGYLQSQGDGEFAVALRSALVRGRSATAWAGAGIVAGSEPHAEFTETELKLRTVLGPLLWGSALMNDQTDVCDIGAANLGFARALVGELRAAGITTAFVCPGSRSAPLALAVAEHAQMKHSVHVDERSAAFQALGFAKASGQPVVLLCTSGTAGANFLPAVAEAAQSRVPLIVLTADRPPELRAWGAAQTMEQRMLYAGFARWSEEAPCPSERGNEVAYARALARRAVIEATGFEPGPVHLNLPFREPLLPAAIDAPGPVERASGAAFHTARLEFDPTLADSLAVELRQFGRGVLLFGPDHWDPSLAAAAHGLAAALGWPIIADPASGLRAGSPVDGAVIHGADLLLRDAEVAASLRPDLIVRFGGQPTSASVVAWMARHPAAEVWLVDSANGFRDPQHRANRCLRASSRRFCELATSAAAAVTATSSWLVQWQQADRVARAAATAAVESERRFLTPHIARALWRLPAGAVLYVANSMAIREIDLFAGPRKPALRVLANRGVNGIDGQVSAALGAAAALRRPTVLWCGDLALLHDVSGLLAGRMHGGDLTIVVSNDDGGGIFEYLPAARLVSRPVFEELFAVPHGLDLHELARGVGWDAIRVDSGASFEQALARALDGGRHVIEVTIDRAVNTAFHAAIHQRVREQLQRDLRG